MANPNVVVATSRVLLPLAGAIVDAPLEVFGGGSALYEIEDRHVIYLRNFWVSNIHASTKGLVSLIRNDGASNWYHTKDEGITVGTKRKNLIQGSVMHIPFGWSLYVQGNEADLMHFACDFEDIDDL